MLNPAYPKDRILGPPLFVLFINDIHTKVLRTHKLCSNPMTLKFGGHIITPADHEILQRDIDALNDWAKLNKINFHAEKCKILSINNFNQNLLQELPFYFYPYELDSTVS